VRVEIKLSADIKEPYAVIYTNEITEEISKINSCLKNSEQVITAYEEDSIVILKRENIYMLRANERKVSIFGSSKEYTSKKCLYEFEELLTKDFMRISKATIINLSHIKRVEPSFNGMLVVMENGCKDYISRKYLPEFKKYLGL